MKRLSSLALVTLIFSFIGWLFEVILFRIAYGAWYDRGFLLLPFCPIYGFTLLIIYLLFGTPSSGGLLLRKIEKGSIRVIIYYIISSLIATLSELIVGWTVERFCGRVLWDYSDYSMTLGRYACVEVSITWGVLISFASFLFHKLFVKIKAMPLHLTASLSLVGWTSILTDFIVNLL